jgi:hypothetical protein
MEVQEPCTICVAVKDVRGVFGRKNSHMIMIPLPLTDWPSLFVAAEPSYTLSKKKEEKPSGT